MSDVEGTASSTGEGDAVDPVARFAADLRRLRLDAESPTLARLQNATGISRSVISDAFAGRSLPSARTVDGLVRACGEDPEAWVTRRDALAEARTRDASAVAPPATAAPAVPAPPPVPMVRVRTAVWIAAAAFFAGLIGSGILTALLVPALIDAGAGDPLIAARTGEDPGVSACLADADVGAASTRVDGSLLEVMWSDACQAAWGRVSRYDALENGNSITVAIYPQDDPYGDDRQEATEPDAQNAYTTLVVRPTPGTRLCAVGSYTVEGSVTDLGDPLCL